MARKKPTMKNDKKRTPARSPGKLTIEDYKTISKNLGMQIDGLTEGTSMFDRLNATKGRVDFLIARLERKLKDPPKAPKEKVKWRCASCGQIHEKRDTVFQCPACKSENLEQFSQE